VIVYFIVRGSEILEPELSDSSEEDFTQLSSVSIRRAVSRAFLIPRSYVGLVTPVPSGSAGELLFDEI
jgi:hypothetical protein